MQMDEERFPLPHKALMGYPQVLGIRETELGVGLNGSIIAPPRGIFLILKPEVDARNQRNMCHRVLCP